MSLILGLGMAHLLSGIGRTIHRRRTVRVDLVHSLWTGSTFLILVLNWWVFFQSRTRESWDFVYFLVVIAWTVLFYLLAVVLYPPDPEPDEDYGTLFRENRRWFLGIWVLSAAVDILLTWLRGDLSDPPHYLPFVSHFILLGIFGLFTESRRFDLFLAGYVFVIGLAWSLGARFLLT